MTRNEADIPNLVHYWYWTHDINCAGTALRILSDLLRFPLQPQVLDAAVGMHGAGGFGAQCGLVKGSLMFLGGYCAAAGKDHKQPADMCRAFAEQFHTRFGALSCSALRPGGFQRDDPPHMCETLTARSIRFAFDFITTAVHGSTPV